MSLIIITYSTSIIITIFVMGWIALYSRKHRDIAGSGEYMWISFLVSLLAVFDGLSMVSPDKKWAIFWYNLRFLSFSFIPPLWLVFIFQYTGKSRILKKYHRAVLFIIPVITQLVIWTNSFHTLWMKRDVNFYHTASFYIAQPMTRIPGIWYKVHLLYTYSLIMTGIIILLSSTLLMQRKSRKQAIVLITGTMVIIIGTLLASFNLLPGMTINTTIPFLALGSVVIASGIFRWRFLSENPVQDKEKKIPVQLIVLFIIMTAGIIITGYINYNYYRREYSKIVENQLSSIANLKVNEIVQWRNERIGDGQFLYKNDLFNSLASRVFFSSANERAKRQMISYLNNILSSFKYSRIHLCNSTGRKILTVPVKSGMYDHDCFKYLDEAKSSGGVILTDFHRETQGKKIHLSVIVPLVTGKNKKISGLLIMLIDPDTYLYPLLKRWPIPSNTAETILIRKEGDEVLFLNELKYRGNTALNFKIPLSSEERTPVMAALGQEGVFEGIDYRGFSVIAALRKVPGTSWSLVTRMDASEVYVPVWGRFWVMFLAIMGFICTAGMGIVLIWRRQNEMFYRNQIETAEALRESEELFRSLFENHAAVKLLIDPETGNIIDANEAAAEFYGWTRDEIKQMSMIQINTLPPDELINKMGEVKKEKRVHFQFKHRRADGSIRVVEVFSSKITFKGKELLHSIIHDITERKKAEEELIFRSAAIDNAANTIIITDTQGIIIYVNPAFEKLTGYSSKEAIGHNPREILKSGQHERDFYKNMWDAILSGNVWHGEIINRRKDDTLYTEEMTITPVIDINKKINYFIAIKQDITSKKIAEKTLLESEDRYKAIVNNQPILVCRWLPDKTLTFANNLYASIFSKYGDIIGKKWVELISEDYRLEYDAFLRDLIEKPRMITHEQPIAMSDGTIKTFSWTDVPIFDSSNNLLEFQTTGIDITERINFENELKKNYNVQRVINELLNISLKKNSLDVLLRESLYTISSLDWLSVQSRGVIFLADPEKRILFPAAYTGISKEPLDCIQHGCLTYGNCLCGKTAETGELVFKDKVDEQHTIRYEGMEPHGHYSVPILHGSSVIGVLNLYVNEGHRYNQQEADFLKAVASVLAGTIIRKRAEEKLGEILTGLELKVADRTADLEKANKELEAFSYSISHDLRAPLRHIMGFLDMFRRETANSISEKTFHYIDVISESTKRMEQLINDLLEFSRMKRAYLSKQNCIINVLVDEVLNEFAEEISSNNISLVKDLLPEVAGDRAMLRVVLINLISNAIKFTAKVSNPEIEIGCNTDGTEHIFHIRDNGAGFDMNYANKLFGVFHRLHSDREFEGTGIGLAMAKNIIERHGGRIWAEGEPGRGACFYFTLPVTKENVFSLQGNIKSDR